MSQKLVPKTQEELGTETKEQRDTDATIRKIDENGVTVDVTTEIMRAEATLLQENGEERKVLDFSEEEQHSSHTVPSEKSIYADVAQTDYWKIVEDLRGQEITTVSVQQDFTAWDILTLMPTPVLTAAVEASSAAYEPLTVQEEHTVSQDTVTQIDTEVQRFFGLDSSHETTVMKDVEYAVRPHVTYEQTIESEHRSYSENNHISFTEYDMRPDDETGLSLILEESLPDSVQYTEDIDAIEQTDADSTNLLTHISYDAEASEVGLREQISYTVTTETSGNAAETLQKLFEQTPISGSVETMTYKDTEDDYKLKESYWVDIDNMDMSRTEFFINGELAANSLDKYTLDSNDTITFVEADLFDSDSGGSCGSTLYLEDVLTEYDAAEETITSVDDYLSVEETSSPLPA